MAGFVCLGQVEGRGDLSQDAADGTKSTPHSKALQELRLVACSRDLLVDGTAETLLG